VAEVAVAGASVGRIRAGRRLAWWVVAIAIAGLVIGYLFLAILSHPLVAGSAEGVDGGVRQQAPNSTPGDGKHIRVLDYVDGKTVTMFIWLGNSGNIPLTLTGVDTAPSYWRGLIGIREARAVPDVDSRGCCRYDDPSPWAESSFQAVVVQPGHQAAVILHLLLSNCEFSSGNVLVGFSTIGVHYSVLAMPRTENVPLLEGVFAKAPDSCPRKASVS